MCISGRAAVKSVERCPVSMLGCRGGGMRGRWVAPLLAHVNLLLVLYGGAALATAARLRWDPSTYVALRELFPQEYAALATTCACAGLALLLLPHIALSRRPTLLYVYAGAMVGVMAGACGVGAWLALRVRSWLQSEAAESVREALELRAHVRPLLQYLGRYHPAPGRIDELLQEAEEDAPRNVYVCAAALALWALLHALAVLLALAAATLERAYQRQRAGPRRSICSDVSVSVSRHSERTPLRVRAQYKNGRLVIL